ncbi:MAG: ParB/RepB/Spo0J family partition protein [Patescibacteria group bacterium]
MKTTKIVTVKIVDLKKNLFVRLALNEDHVLYLADLIGNGVKLSPITITPDLTVNDGRHRIAAYELLGLTEIEAEVVNIGSEIEQIAMAFKANVGGSLPPTQQDVEHTIELLLERGETKKRIGELLGLPAGMARRYVDVVQSRVARTTLMKAVAAVTDGGLTVAKAAEMHGVDPEKVKAVLSGHRRNNKLGGMAEIHRNLTKTYKSLSSRNAALVRGILVKHEDGDMSEKQVREIFAHIELLQKQSARAVADRMARFDAKTKERKTGKAA